VEERKPQPQTVAFNPPPAIARPSPTDRFQASISTALGCSFDNFKRTVSREVSNAFRQHSSRPDSSVYEKFIHDLVGQVSEIFGPSPVIVSDDQLILQKLNAEFDDSANAIRLLFQESVARASREREKKVSELNQLSISVNELRTSVMGIANATLHELENERFEVAGLRDQEQARVGALERRSRSLKVKHADLDSRLRHQKIEKESVERLLKQIDDTRREWEEATSESAASAAQRMQKEIELLRSELDHQADEAFERTLEECTALMSAVCDGLRDEMCEMEMTERWAAGRIRSPMRRAPVGRAENTQPLLQQAREKVQAYRRQRELGMKDVTENMKAIGETQCQ
jgi:hypothetical protein